MMSSVPLEGSGEMLALTIVYLVVTRSRHSFMRCRYLVYEKQPWVVHLRLGRLNAAELDGLVDARVRHVPQVRHRKLQQA